MYKLTLNQFDQPGNMIKKIGEGATTFIPINSDNADYQNFKREINADEAQLEDADGNLMSPEQAKAYVATLP